MTQALHLCFMLSPCRQLAGRSQPQPLVWIHYQSHLLWSPGLFLQESFPMSVFPADYSRAWHFPCLVPCCLLVHLPKANWGLFTHTVNSLLSRFMIVTLSSPITALSTLCCPADLSQLLRGGFKQVTGAMSSAWPLWHRKVYYSW